MSKCPLCEKTVYPMEEIKYDSISYHKGCFKCLQCRSTLTASGVAKIVGKIYCKPCFKKIFKTKGSYASFGVETLAKNAPMKDIFASNEAPVGRGSISQSPTAAAAAAAVAPTVAAIVEEEAKPEPVVVEEKPVPVVVEEEKPAPVEVVAPKEEVPILKPEIDIAIDESVVIAPDADTKPEAATPTSSYVIVDKPKEDEEEETDTVGTLQGAPVVEELAVDFLTPRSSATDSATTPRGSTYGRVSVSVAGTAKKCERCKKTVYPLEMMSYDSLSWHKACFKCTKCSSVITTTGNVCKMPSLDNPDENQIFCKSCFTKSFRSKGQYNTILE